MLSSVERGRLLQLCTYLTGDSTVAEDLVQETLIVAWEKIDQLRDPERYIQWLEGIARNRCRQWLRGVRRRRALFTEPTFDVQEGSAAPSDLIAGTFDIEIELDRNELATLLDQALALLPPLTRTVLIERYIHKSPQVEVARQLGLTEGAVEQRIQRGKLALRRVLTTDLQEDAAAFGLVTPDDIWQETRMWCPCCGRQRLQAYLASGIDSSLALRCAACETEFGTDTPGLFNGIRGYRTALTRFAKWYHAYFQQGLAQGSIACAKCGHETQLHLSPNAHMPAAFADMAPAMPGTHGFWTSCTNCHQWTYQSNLAAIAFFVPEVQQFWRAHPRMRVLPKKPIEMNGKSMLLISYQDATGLDQIDLLFECATLTYHTAYQTHG